jgi:hypothetical protein
MRYGRAVQRLEMIAERCQWVSGLWDEAPPLIGAYAFGHVLDGPDQLDAVQVALVLNHPAEELTWCARPTSCSGLPHLLELEKAPVEWYWRPSGMAGQQPRDRAPAPDLVSRRGRRCRARCRRQQGSRAAAPATAGSPTRR